jgi:tetratricopeptide (TPR) repeat protein
MPFARSKPKNTAPKVAQRPTTGRNTQQQAVYGQRSAAGQVNGAMPSRNQMPPAAMSANANMQRVPVAAPIQRPVQAIVRAAAPFGNQPTAIANPPTAASSMRSPRAAAPEVAPNLPAQQVLTQAHELSNQARTTVDFSRIIAICEQVQMQQSDAQLAGYAKELCSWALNRRGQLNAEAGCEEEAIRDFDYAIAADGKRWRAFHNRGVLLAQAGQFEPAFDDFNTTIELKPNFAKAYSNRGALFVVAGNYKAAAEDYEQAIQMDPKLAIAHRGMARACHLMGDLEVARQHYDEAVELAPEDAYAVASRADVLTDLGQFAEAAAEYERAIKIDPRSGHAHSGSAWLLATCPDDKIRNPKLALERAKKGLELNGDEDASSFDTLAAAHASAGDFAAAVRNIQEAIDLASDDEKAAYQDRLAMYQDSVAYQLEIGGPIMQASYEEEECMAPACDDDD